MIPDLTLLQKLVYFTFVFTFIGMAAASVFFLCARTSLHPQWRYPSLISGIITMVAAITYFYMKDIYVVGIASGERTFPTEFRYIDWFITVPLMLVKFPSLLGLGPRGIRFMTQLVLMSIIMLTASFIGEVNFDNKQLHYSFYGIGCLAWVVIVFMLYDGIKQIPSDRSPAVRKAATRIFLFIFIGWIIYPVGFIIPNAGVSEDWRELLYNVGDLINKVGLGLVVIAGSAARIKEDEVVADQAQP